MAIGAKSGIGWTDQTQNVLAGCKEIDPGCFNCYAKHVAQKLSQSPNEKIRAKYLPVVKNHEWTGEVTVTEKEIVAPLRKSKSGMIFVNSMSDLFYEEVSDEVIDRHLVVMYLAKWHYFQVLTKRHERLKSYMENVTAERLNKALNWIVKTFDLNVNKVLNEVDKTSDERFAATGQKHFFGDKGLLFPLDNVIWCVSASNQRGAELRIPALLSTPYIKNRGVSLEPLIGEVDLTHLKSGNGYINALEGRIYYKYEGDEGGHYLAGETAKLNWGIVGGESSKLLSEKVRPLHPGFLRIVINQCYENKVPVFFKQWGDWLPVDAWKNQNYRGEWVLVQGNGIIHRNQTLEEAKSVAGFTQAFARVGKDKAGNEIDGQKFEQFPEIKFGEYVNYWQKKK